MDLVLRRIADEDQRIRRLGFKDEGEDQDTTLEAFLPYAAFDNKQNRQDERGTTAGNGECAAREPQAMRNGTSTEGIQEHSAGCTTTTMSGLAPVIGYRKRLQALPAVK